MLPMSYRPPNQLKGSCLVGFTGPLSPSNRGASSFLEPTFSFLTICVVPVLPCSVLSRSLFGRSQKVLTSLVDPRVPCVTITGERGSGKTEMAVQACDYVRKRHHFESFLWADVNKAAQGSGDLILEPCRLVRDESVHRATGVGLPARLPACLPVWLPACLPDNLTVRVLSLSSSPLVSVGDRSTER